MGRLEIRPGELIAARSKQGELAEQTRALRAHLDGAAGGAGAAGDPDAGAAVEEFARGWATNLATLDQALDALAGNLGPCSGRASQSGRSTR